MKPIEPVMVRLSERIWKDEKIKIEPWVVRVAYDAIFPLSDGTVSWREIVQFARDYFPDQFVTDNKPLIKHLGKRVGK